MNPDNPYGAPQTVDPRAELPVAQPAVSLHNRAAFPDLSLAELTQLESASRAIHRMTILCGLLFAIAVSLTLVFSITADATLGELLGLIALCVLLVIRIYSGIVRGRVMRCFSFVTDLLISLVSIYYLAQAITSIRMNPGLIDQSLRVSLLLFLVFLTLLPSLSVLAHRHATLFGDHRYDHEELLQELKYRRRHQIT